MTRRGLLMLMEVSELRELAETYFGKISKEAKDQITSLLDKCDDFNFISQKWSKPPKTDIAEDVHDRLKQTIDDTIMKRLETWLPWAGLVEELRVEIKIAYDKFIILRKKYSELIEKSRGNQRNELIKAYIARDIQDYIMYGINLFLLCVEKNYLPMIWIGRIEVHFEILAGELEGLDVRNEDEVRRLAEDVSLYKQCMFDFGNHFVNVSDSLADPLYRDAKNIHMSSEIYHSLNEFNSKTYLMLLQKGGIPFSDVVKRKMNELKFEADFHNLEYSQQVEVYQGIINEVGGKDSSEIQFVEFIFGHEDGNIALKTLLTRCND